MWNRERQGTGFYGIPF